MFPHEELNRFALSPWSLLNRFHNLLRFGMIESCDIDPTLDVLGTPSMTTDVLKLAASYLFNRRNSFTAAISSSAFLPGFAVRMAFVTWLILLAYIGSGAAGLITSKSLG